MHNELTNNRLTDLDTMLSEIQTIPNKTGKHFVVDLILPTTMIQCSISKIVEGVIIKLRYIPSDVLLEVSSFRKCFENKHLEITFEELVSGIYEHLNHLLLPVNLYVEVEKTSEKSSKFIVSYGNFD